MDNTEIKIDIGYKLLSAVGSIARMPDDSGKRYIKNEHGGRIGFYDITTNKTHRRNPSAIFGEGNCSSALILTDFMERNPKYREFFNEKN